MLPALCPSIWITMCLRVYSLWTLLYLLWLIYVIYTCLTWWSTTQPLLMCVCVHWHIRWPLVYLFNQMVLEYAYITTINWYNVCLSIHVSEVLVLHEDLFGFALSTTTSLGTCFSLLCMLPMLLHVYRSHACCQCSSYLYFSLMLPVNVPSYICLSLMLAVNNPQMFTSLYAWCQCFPYAYLSFRLNVVIYPFLLFVTITHPYLYLTIIPNLSCFDE